MFVWEKKVWSFPCVQKRQISGVDAQMMFISQKVRESFFNARQSRQPCHLDRPRARTSLIINIFPIIIITILVPTNTMCNWSHGHLHYFFALNLHFNWFNVVISSMLKEDSDQPHQCIAFIFYRRNRCINCFSYVQETWVFVPFSLAACLFSPNCLKNKRMTGQSGLSQEDFQNSKSNLLI